MNATIKHLSSVRLYTSTPSESRSARKSGSRERASQTMIFHNKAVVPYLTQNYNHFFFYCLIIIIFMLLAMGNSSLNGAIHAVYRFKFNQAIIFSLNNITYFTLRNYWIDIIFRRSFLLENIWHTIPYYFFRVRIYNHK